jgi:hypothetical protein
MYTPVASFPSGTNPSRILAEAPHYQNTCSVFVLCVRENMGRSLFQVVTQLPLEEEMCIRLVSEQFFSRACSW